MMTEQAIKIVGMAATVVGLGATVVAGWVEDKKTDFVIEKKVAEAIAKLKV